MQSLRVFFPDYDPRPSIWPHSSEPDKVSIQQIVGQLRNISTLTLFGLSSRSLAVQFPLDDLQALAYLAGPRRVSLQLNKVKLTGEELVSLLGGFKDIVGSLSMSTMYITSNQWQNVFQTIRTLQLWKVDR